MCMGVEGEFIVSEKMVVHNGTKYTPIQFETFAGSKARRWKRSISLKHHNYTKLGDFLDQMEKTEQGGT